MSAAWDNRHPSVREKCRWLEPNPSLPPGAPATVADMFRVVRDQLLAVLGDGPQPAHLYEGTQSQNMHDMYDRGRHPRIRVGRTRLSDFVRDEVRRMRAAGLTQDKIARELRIGQGSVSRILAEVLNGAQV